MLEGLLKLTGNADATGALRPRLQAEASPGATGGYTLLLEVPSPDGNSLYLRLYYGSVAVAQRGWVFTINASWDGSDWHRDASGDSLIFEVANDIITAQVRDSASADGWGDSDWDTSPDGARAITIDTDASDKSHVSTDRVTVNDYIDALGVALLSSAADAAVPRIEMDFPNVTTGRYTCLWEMDDTGTAGFRRNVRLYVTGSSAVGDSPVNQTFLITINASWDGSLWGKDQTGDAAERFDFGTGGSTDGLEAGFSWFHMPATQNTDWADTSWDAAGGSGERLFTVDNPDNELMVNATLEDGRILFENTSDLDTDGSNPPTADYVRNMLCALNVVKAFARFGVLNLTTGPIEVGLNFDAHGYVAGGGAPATAYYYLDFDVAFANVDDWAAVITVHIGGGTGYFAQVFSTGSTASRLAFKVFDGAGSDLTGTLTCDFGIVVMGKYIN